MKEPVVRMSKAVATGTLRKSRFSEWKRAALIPSLSFSASVFAHTIALCVLALIVYRIPSQYESYWIDFSTHVEQPLEELFVDTGFSEEAITNAIDPGLDSTDLQIDSSSTVTLSFPPANSFQTGGSGKASDQVADGVHATSLPESIAKLVASRGGRVLKGQQRGVSATLKWEGHDDLDLYVELANERCFFRKMKTPSLELDIDANYLVVVDNPVENIVTRARSRLSGRFRVSVHHYESRNQYQARPFTVFVVADGVCRTFKGQVAPDEMKLICEFEGDRPFATSERIAESTWLTAQSAMKRGHTEAAIELLRELVENHPDTAVGKKAKDLLKANGATVTQPDQQLK